MKQHKLVPNQDESGTFTYYTDEQIVGLLSIAKYEEFAQWMNGQTGAIVDGQLVYYASDFDRWWDMVYNGKETHWD